MSQLPRRALIALTSHSAPFYPDGRANGVFYTEVAHPYRELIRAGFDVLLASETGSFSIDAYSLEAQFLNDEDTHSLATPDEPLSVALRADVRKAIDVDEESFGLFFASAGFASLYDYPSAKSLQLAAADVWKRGGVVAAVCHGGAIFPGVTDPTTGKSIIAGKKVTGFSTEGDKMAGVLGKIREDGVRTTEESAISAEAVYLAPPTPFEAFHVANGRLVTGANPASARETALAAIQAFDKTSN